MRKTYKEALKALREKQKNEREVLEKQYKVMGCLPIEPKNIFITQEDAPSEQAWITYKVSTLEEMWNIISSFKENIVPVVYATNGCFVIKPRDIVKSGYKINETSESEFYIQAEMNRNINDKTRSSLIFYISMEGLLLKIEIELDFNLVRLSIDNRKCIVTPNLSYVNHKLRYGSDIQISQTFIYMVSNLRDFMLQEF